eukprot:1152183-Pelagomonas_calceolata.AAC.3
MGSEAYAFVKDLGIGNFGIAKLLQHRQTGQLVAAKYIERGPDKVLLTPTHLIIIMEFAAGRDQLDQLESASLLTIVRATPSLSPKFFDTGSS